MRRGLFWAAAFLTALLHAGDLMAAIASKRDGVRPEMTWNPRPEQDDILLPMPCGLKMALRAVAVPVGGLLQDRRFFMGIGATDDDRRQIYERRFPSHIAAPFTAADLPPSWKSQLPAASESTWYFIGKYEVSEYQWDAVMGGQCPAAPGAGANRPKRGVSWHDAQRFFQTYNSWLLANAPESLPRFQDNTRNTGFLRLPTEEEWEYAARGGGRVREEDLMQNDIFPLGADALSDYGLFSESVPVHEPGPIGARKPNPLGLYDTVGNVKELVDGFFRLSVADTNAGGGVYRRLHGASGGMLCKGGSFRSDARGVLPGWRDEIPQYTVDGENRPADLGFRVALAGLNVPSGQRLNALVQEYRKGPQPAKAAKEPLPASVPPASPAEPPRDKALTLDPEGSPLTELDRISGAAATPEMRGNLAQLRALLEDAQAADQRRRAEMRENSLRALLYQAETLRSFAYRYHTANLGLQTYLKARKTPGEDGASRNARAVLRSNYELILTAANFYKTCLQRLLDVPAPETARLLEQLRQEYRGADMLNEHMRQNIAALEKHLALARSKGIDALGQKALCKDIIPEMHFKVLPF